MSWSILLKLSTCCHSNASSRALQNRSWMLGLQIQNRLPQRAGEQIVDVIALQSVDEIVGVFMLIPQTRT